MFNKFIPFAYAQSIYEIPVDFYQKNDVLFLLIDLDNTLDSYRLSFPTERAKELVLELKKVNIEPILISNNCGKRVCSYAKALEIECLHSARKPFSQKLNKYLKTREIKNSQALLVGDQLMTDVLAAKGTGIRVILTEKIVKEDQWTTHFNRLLDRPIRRYLKKKGLLPDWRKKYGQK